MINRSRLIVIVAAFISPFASTHPDGLERVAQDKGFLQKGAGSEVISSPIAHYQFPWVGNEAVAKSVAGVSGTMVTFGAVYGLGKLVKRKNK